MAAADDRARKAWWASIGVGALACVGCCVVVPLLAAAGIAGGGMLLVGSRWLDVTPRQVVNGVVSGSR
ncbi:hypothetical protein [Mycolicibacterium fortuitum]|uniref:hypothetical protein n=1 Tax=Mycolicibacterium fortuitum TaxID=1766 RepID=UPI000AA64425|nr:hypothetical protein [Mycolicibacterium fortuitum]